MIDDIVNRLLNEKKSFNFSLPEMRGINKLAKTYGNTKAIYDGSDKNQASMTFYYKTINIIFTKDDTGIHLSIGNKTIPVNSIEDKKVQQFIEKTTPLAKPNKTVKYKRLLSDEEKQENDEKEEKKRQKEEQTRKEREEWNRQWDEKHKEKVKQKERYYNSLKPIKKFPKRKDTGLDDMLYYIVEGMVFDPIIEQGIDVLEIDNGMMTVRVKTEKQVRFLEDVIRKKGFMMWSNDYVVGIINIRLKG